MNGVAQKNQRILIVDDNRAIHDDFGKILAPQGAEQLARFEAEEAVLFGEPVREGPTTQFELDSAYQGAEGIELVRKALGEGAPYALAFVDVRMPPGLDGIETARRILEIDPCIQIVICTAYADYSWDEMFAGMSRHDGMLILKKPFDSVEVLQMAHALTEKWRLHRQSRLKMEDLERTVRERTREIRRAKHFVENIIETANLVFVQLDGEGRVRKVNSRTREICGLSSEEIIGRNWFEFMIPPEKLTTLWEEWLAVKERGKAVEVLDCPILAKDGSRREFLWQTSVLREGETFMGTISFGLDVTERKRLEERLRESRKTETVAKLAGGVAHEFNNLLMGILGQVELMIEELDEAQPLRANALAIQSVAQRAAGLTRQLLAYGRRQHLRVEMLDLNGLLLRSEPTIREVAGKRVETRLELSSQLYSVTADAGQIEQVVTNLVANARDAMPDGGRLLITTGNVTLPDGLEPDLPPGDYAILSITDSGSGITEEIRTRAFEPFFTTKRVGEGTGLGLPTSYGIVKQSGGHLAVTSEPGAGATFRLYLPAAPKEAIVGEGDAAILETLGGKETILLVEPEPLLRDIAVMFLERLGYRVLAAETGAKALALMEAPDADPIDLLLADAALLQSGCESFARRVHAGHPEARIILTVADTEPVALQNGIRRNGNVLHKPFTPVILARKVREVLDAPLSGANGNPG